MTALLDKMQQDLSKQTLQNNDTLMNYNTPQKLDNKLRYDDERKNIIFNKKNLCPQQEENSAKSSKRKSF